MPAAPYFVGIAGGSGSGKTSLVRALRERMPGGRICVISQDDYYRPIAEQTLDANGRVNFDLPGGIDLDGLAGDLRELAAGGMVFRKEYTFNTESHEPRLIELRPAPVVLVEGLFVMHHTPIRDLLDLRVFVEASEDTQLERRLRRDVSERGYGHEDILYQWHHHVLPAYRDFLLPYRHLCDLHVVNESGFGRAVDVLRNHLLQAAASVTFSAQEEGASLQGS